MADYEKWDCRIERWAQFSRHCQITVRKGCKVCISSGRYWEELSPHSLANRVYCQYFFSLILRVKNGISVVLLICISLIIHATFIFLKAIYMLIWIIWYCPFPTFLLDFGPLLLDVYSSFIYKRIFGLVCSICCKYFLPVFQLWYFF